MRSQSFPPALVLLLTTGAAASSGSGGCSIVGKQRVGCGPVGAKGSSCLRLGCCYDAEDEWCWTDAGSAAAAAVPAPSAYPNYPNPFPILSLSVTCDQDGRGCDGTVCDWLNLIAGRGNFTSLAQTRAFVEDSLATIPTSRYPWLRLPPFVWEAVRDNYTNTACTFAPKKPGFRPWRKSIAGPQDSENHHMLFETDKVRVMNVHAPAGGAEQFHAHQPISIFFHWGFEPCQIGYEPDGSTSLGPDPPEPECVKTVTPQTPKIFRVLFTGPQWLHANRLYAPMAYPNAMNCPHENAPDRCDGFMTRVFFKLNETDVLYPEW